jgi:hypothetical protein
LHVLDVCGRIAVTCVVVSKVDSAIGDRYAAREFGPVAIYREDTATRCERGDTPTSLGWVFLSKRSKHCAAHRFNERVLQNDAQIGPASSIDFIVDDGACGGWHNSGTTTVDRALENRV